MAAHGTFNEKIRLVILHRLIMPIGDDICIGKMALLGFPILEFVIRVFILPSVNSP
jgi:hypothetical protein